MEITFDEFMKLDLRIGKIIEAEHLGDSKNLIKMIVDFGSKRRQCVTGLLQYYQPQELVDKKFAFVLNLKRKKFMGVESQCMILAADDNKRKIVLMKPERDIEIGSRIL